MISALYSNWIRTMSDLQETGCTHVEGAATLPMSSGANTNSYCCLPTPKGSDPLHPKISYCSPQYNQSDTLGSIPDGMITSSRCQERLHFWWLHSCPSTLTCAPPYCSLDVPCCCCCLVVPNNWGNGGSRGWPGAPTWSVAYIIIPGHVLQYTNDTSLIKTYYAGFKVRAHYLAAALSWPVAPRTFIPLLTCGQAHVNFLARQRKFGNGVPQFGLLGDWCSVEPFCPGRIKFGNSLNCLNLIFSVTGALSNRSTLVGSSDGCLANPGWTNGDATTAFYFIKSLENLIHMAKVAEKSADVTTYTSMLKLAKQSVRKLHFENRILSVREPSGCVVTCTVPS